MEQIAEASRHDPDAKDRRLIDWIREHMCQACRGWAGANRRAGAVERPPRAHLHRVPRRHQAIYSRSLEQAIEATDRADERIAVITGLTSGEARKEIKRRFNTDPPRIRSAS